MLTKKIESIYFMKNNASILILLISSVLISFSCNKKEKRRIFHLWGKIASQYDHTPIKSAAITVYSQDKDKPIETNLVDWDAGANWGYNPIVARGFSDSNGKFDITYEDYDNTKQRAFYIAQNQYFDESLVDAGGEGDKGVLTMMPLYFYKVRIKNSTPFNINDSFRFETFVGSHYWLKGPNVDTTIILSEIYVYNLWIDWDIYKNNMTPYPKKNTATFNCKPLDTCSFNLDY